MIWRKASAFMSSLILSACSVTHKVEFDSAPCLIPAGGYYFRLCEDFIYFVDGLEVKVPRHFITDLASIPRFLWPIYSPNKSETISGAVIHDYLYSCGSGVTRAQADSLFYDALIAGGTSKSTAFKYWLGVRIFGFRHFNKFTKCDELI